VSREVTALGRHDDWSGVRAVVAGFGVSGFAAADNLTHLGAAVVALDDDAAGKEEQAELLGVLGADVRLGSGATSTLPEGTDLLVVSPGWKPSAPLLAQAGAAGVPVWGEVELAWRLRDVGPAGTPAPWLAVTGTYGKTTTVRMLDAILRAAGLRSIVAGHAGIPLVEAVMDPAPYDVFVVELSCLQLQRAESMAAQAAAVLNIGEHPQWYDGPGDTMAAQGSYTADLGRVYAGVERACVYDVTDPETERLVREADVVEGARAIGFTLGMPGVGMVGVVDRILVDRAFIAERQSSAAELCTIDDLASPEPHVVADALAAAALARAHGVSQAAVRDGLRATRLDGPGAGDPPA
jgi:UDP-N-acetylmuramoylalanine--D-glutamate ligase